MLGAIFHSLWKLFLLGIFTLAKAIQALAGITAKVAEKMLN